MKYDRLTRLVKFDVGGVEYAARLTNGMLEQIEDLCPQNSLMRVLENVEYTPRKVLRVAFCLALSKDGEKVKNPVSVFDKYFEEVGVEGVIQTFSAMIAASNYLGVTQSKTILESLALVVKDKETDDTEKNA